MAQCVRVAFFNFKDLIKDTFLLSKMIISVSVPALILNPSSFATIVSLLMTYDLKIVDSNIIHNAYDIIKNNQTYSNFQVIVSTFLTLAVPMYIIGIQTTANDPELPLGLAAISPGCKRKTIQILMMIFSPITIILLKLQHQIVQRKREKILDKQNEYLVSEFNKLSSLLQKMEEHKKKMIKTDSAFEVAHQMFINLVLVLFSTSGTRTETGMEALFNQEGKDEYLGVSNLTLFIISTVASFFSFLKQFTNAHANTWHWKAKLLVALYGLISLAMRLQAMLVYFMPSLGLVNCLRHYQTERIPFTNDNRIGGQKYDFFHDKLYFGNAPVIDWADITRVDYSNPYDPSPPPYSIYTGLTSSTFFIIFVFLWLLQIYVIWLYNIQRSNAFQSLSTFDQLLHSFQSVITPAPSVDWADGQGDEVDHFNRMKMNQKEVIGVIKINAFFNFIYLLPLAYLGNYKSNLQYWNRINI